MNIANDEKTVSRQGSKPFVLRIAGPVGWFLATVALIAFVYDFISFAESGAYRVIPAGELWFNVHVASLNLIQAVIQRYVHPFLWDPIIATVLQWPLWSLLGAPAAILLAIVPNRRSASC